VATDKAGLTSSSHYDNVQIQITYVTIKPRQQPATPQPSLSNPTRTPRAKKKTPTFLNAKKFFIANKSETRKYPLKREAKQIPDT